MFRTMLGIIEYDPKKKDGSLKKNCYNCEHLDQADFGDYGSGGEFMCGGRTFRTNDEYTEHEYKLDEEKYRLKSKRCCKLK